MKDIEYENSKNYIYEEKLLFTHSYLISSSVEWSQHRLGCFAYTRSYL